MAKLLCLMAAVLGFGSGSYAQEMAMNDAGAGPVRLTVTISGLKDSLGTVWLSVFDDPKAFPSNGSRAVRVAKVKAVMGSVEAVIENLPAGDYAISTFQDQNDNGKLDTNPIGIPKEPFGFSNNPVIRFGAPTFNQAKIHLEKTDEATVIRLTTFKL